MKKGFTLVELLIVIGILAVLTAAVVIVLNPAQLLAQARDSQRMSDLNSIKSAVSLYLASVDSPTLAATTTCTFGTACYFTTTTCVTNSSTLVNGTGWVAINLGSITGGSPLSRLPLDPTNNATYFYSYTAENTNKTFEVNAVLESTKYSPNMGTDGGSTSTAYEIGTNLSL